MNIKKIIIFAAILSSCINVFSANVTETNDTTFTGTTTISNDLNVSGNVFINGNQVPTNSVDFSPTNIISTASNMLDLANGWLQQLVLTNTTILYAPTSPITNQIHGLRLELYIGASSFTLGTNSMYIGTNNTIGAGVADFMSRLQTNRYNSLLFDKGIGETYFRVFGLNI